MFDSAYSELLDTNQELRSELQDEIFINKSNEKKIRSLVKELEQCYRTISIQDNTIIAHEKEIEKLKSEISDLRKQLRVLQQDKKFKDEVGSIQNGRIIELENKVGSLKARIRILIDKKISINALDMATTNLIANINRGLDRIENHIKGVGTPMQNPANVINGIRGLLNTIRVTLQNITAERDQFQNLLHDSIQRVDNLRNQFTDSGNQNLRLQRLLDESRVRVEKTVRERDNAQGERDLAMLAYNNERQESRSWMYSYRDKDRRVQGLLREKFAKQLLYQRDTNRLQQNTRQLQTNAQNQVNRMLIIIARKQTRIGELLREKFVFQLVIRQRDQNNLNLQQQILALQNNPPNIQHMAQVHEIHQILTPQLGQIKLYKGQCTPDYFIQQVTNVFESARNVITVANNVNANTFADADKCDILKSMMGDKFSPVPANDPYTGGNPAINTPATFTVWLRHKYREVMAENAELALQSLIQEKFNLTDSPDVYESRVQKHIVGFADDQILPALYTYLPPDLRNSIKIYMTIRDAGNQTVDNFFADLRKCWVERQVGSNIYPQSVTMGNQIQSQVSSQGVASAEMEKLYSKIASLETQLAESMQVHSNLVQRLQLPENVINSNSASTFEIGRASCR